MNFKYEILTLCCVVCESSVRFDVGIGDLRKLRARAN